MSDLSELVARVVTRLVERGIGHRLIGAAALAAHGAARSTRDIDLLVADPAVLDPALWRDLPPGYAARVRRGDATDPLLGVVRLEEEAGDERSFDEGFDQIDVVVVRGRWAAAMTESPGPTVTLGRTPVQAVTAADLVLLKLYAGGPRDAWDIALVLEVVEDPAALVGEVEARLSSVPERCARLWRRLREPADR